MKTLFTIALTSLFLFTATTSIAEWQPDKSDKMDLKVAKAKLDALENDPGLQAWFDSAAGYAIYPTVGKAGMGIGGARGKGLVIQGDTTLAETTLTQLTVGFQLGAQAYIEIIFFKDQTALDTFMRGEFELGAQASAVALTAGASVDANYSKGVAVFTIAEGGLMYEATVGGQKFNVKKR